MGKLQRKTEMCRERKFSVPYLCSIDRAHLRTVRDCPLPTSCGALFEDHCAWSTISWRVLCGQQSYADSTTPWRLLRRGRSCGRHTVKISSDVLISTVNTFRKIIRGYVSNYSYRNSGRKYLQKNKRKKRRCYCGNLSFYDQYY